MNIDDDTFSDALREFKEAAALLASQTAEVESTASKRELEAAEAGEAAKRIANCCWLRVTDEGFSGPDVPSERIPPAIGKELEALNISSTKVRNIRNRLHSTNHQLRALAKQLTAVLQQENEEMLRARRNRLRRTAWCAGVGLAVVCALIGYHLWIAEETTVSSHIPGPQDISSTGNSISTQLDGEHGGHAIEQAHPTLAEDRVEESRNQVAIARATIPHEPAALPLQDTILEAETNAPVIPNEAARSPLSTQQMAQPPTEEAKKDIQRKQLAAISALDPNLLVQKSFNSSAIEKVATAKRLGGSPVFNGSDFNAQTFNAQTKFTGRIHRINLKDNSLTFSQLLDRPLNRNCQVIVTLRSDQAQQLRTLKKKQVIEIAGTLVNLEPFAGGSSFRIYVNNAWISQ